MSGSLKPLLNTTLMKEGTMNSILDTEKGICYLCNAVGYTEEHHMIHGANRKHAEKYGLKVYICKACHMGVHDKGINDRYLKEVAQRKFEENHTHEEFMRIFGKNYL